MDLDNITKILRTQEALIFYYVLEATSGWQPKKYSFGIWLLSTGIVVCSTVDLVIFLLEYYIAGDVLPFFILKCNSSFLFAGYLCCNASFFPYLMNLFAQIQRTSSICMVNQIASNKMLHFFVWPNDKHLYQNPGTKFKLHKQRNVEGFWLWSKISPCLRANSNNTLPFSLYQAHFTGACGTRRVNPSLGFHQ